MGSQNRLAGSQCMQAKRSMQHRAEIAGVADGHHLPAVDDVWDGTMGLKADPEALMLLFGRVSWAFLQVQRLESLLFCRLSGTRLRPGFRLPISSVRADIFCFDPLMARGHLVWACRLPVPAIALAARRLQLAESWPGHAGTAAHSRIALFRPCSLLIAGIFRRYNARQADGLSPSPNP